MLVTSSMLNVYGLVIYAEVAYAEKTVVLRIPCSKQSALQAHKTVCAVNNIHVLLCCVLPYYPGCTSSLMEPLLVLLLVLRTPIPHTAWAVVKS